MKERMRIAAALLIFLVTAVSLPDGAAAQGKLNWNLRINETPGPLRSADMSAPPKRAFGVDDQPRAGGETRLTAGFPGPRSQRGDSLQGKPNVGLTTTDRSHTDVRREPRLPSAQAS